ncbi:MAG: YHS domain-containing protein [Flavobacteriales bacterium]|nr:YHS domain-containing protein [Flavobacteriales bacterium]
MRILILLFLCTLQLSSFAQDETARKKHYNLTDNVALSGYDPVSYFVNKPVEGKKEFAYTYKGITYYFLTEKSQAIFKANPEKYEPQYGGWCAYALAKEEPQLMEADPLTYKITDGKLYVFYNAFGINTKKKWTKNEPNMQSTADKNWGTIIKE